MNFVMVGIAWYRREDYERLLTLVTDREEMPDRYDDWLGKAERLTAELRRDGQAFLKVYINPDTFPAWCAARGLKPDGDARSLFASEKVSGTDLVPKVH